MFDKMIVSEAKGSETKGRSRYFLVSSAIVGILFVTAVVFSIYAADIGLGNEEFEISMMLAPVTPDEPEPPNQVQPQNQQQSRQSPEPTRVQNILRPEESPTIIPDSVSVSKNPFLTRPPGQFRTDSYDSAGIGVTDGIDRPGSGGKPSGSGSQVETEAVANHEKPVEPPPAIKPKPAAPKSLGVINGKASSLPKPPYPAAAIAVKAEGEVKVQVMIDETGRVVSAAAVSGHPLLRREAERAAMNARFSPTTLSKVPVKVTGMIVYNFKRS